MIFDTTLSEMQAHAFIHRFIEIATPETIQKRFTWIDREINENPFMEEWLLEYHGTLMRLGKLITSMTDSGGFTPGIQDKALYDLYSFTAGFVHIYERLSVNGQNRFKGMLYDGLTSDKGLTSVEHEVTTALHLMRHGFDVEFNDLERGGVDFIVRRGDVEIEVECKVFTTDLGRQIHKRPAIKLQYLMSQEVIQIYNAAIKGILIRVVIPARLSANPVQAQSIKREFSRGVLLGNNKAHSEYCDIEVLDFEIAGSPFNTHPFDRNAAAGFIGNLIGIPRLNTPMIISYSPNQRVVVVVLDSAKSDDVLRGMKRQLKEAVKGQFTKTRPGVLMVDVLGMTGDQMEGLHQLESSEPGEPTGLRKMTSHFLNNEDRKHIHTVAYRGHGNVIQRAGITTEQGISYIIRNPNNPFYDDSRYRMFDPPSK